MLTGIKHSVPHNYCKFDFNLSKSLILRSEKKKQTLHHQPSCGVWLLVFDTIGQHISLAKSRSTQPLGLNLSIHDQ